MKTRKMTMAALMAALLGISAYISIPIGISPVMITLQTMILNIIAIILTPTEAFFAILIYALVGIAGVPVFSGGLGGVSALLRPTGGYVLGLLIATPAMSYTKDIFAKLFGRFIKSEKIAKITGYSVNAVLVGMVLIYVVAMIYMKLFLGKAFGAVLATMVLPFIPMDIVKCIVAAIVSVPLKKALNR